MPGNMLERRRRPNSRRGRFPLSLTNRSSTGRRSALFSFSFARASSPLRDWFFSKRATHSVAC